MRHCNQTLRVIVARDLADMLLNDHVDYARQKGLVMFLSGLFILRNSACRLYSLFSSRKKLSSLLLVHQIRLHSCVKYLRPISEIRKKRSSERGEAVMLVSNMIGRKG